MFFIEKNLCFNNYIVPTLHTYEHYTNFVRHYPFLHLSIPSFSDNPIKVANYCNPSTANRPHGRPNAPNVCL